MTGILIREAKGGEKEGKAVRRGKQISQGVLVPPVATRSQERGLNSQLLPSEPLEETSPATSAFRLPVSRTAVEFLFFKPPVFDNLFQRPQETIDLILYLSSIEGSKTFIALYQCKGYVLEAFIL